MKKPKKDDKLRSRRRTTSLREKRSIMVVEAAVPL